MDEKPRNDGCVGCLVAALLGGVLGAVVFVIAVGPILCMDSGGVPCPILLAYLLVIGLAGSLGLLAIVLAARR